ncbi:hypothetical protein CYLTODRAFT_451981 [Cylindrobasidium torrendii FP15055 ss-10]|uniref:Vacuolar protein sorting-associated protein 62 n=1 Tax=Cylindrobasidium torrendii FP15055 ss-10 TaxID=1314674 RepID=A0A0D7BI22_9AGAR|nr:hypothetical protein CYLTODRAFT_451981 [Cylindrobasidium torrendii FP15055 ss-10]
MASRAVFASTVLVSLFSCVAHGTSLPLQKRDAIPDYALTYAPQTYLYSGEEYFPSDIVEHLAHTVPKVNFSAVGDAATLQTLNAVSTDAFLTSLDDPDADPRADWMTSVANKPDGDGLSPAPATIIAVNKADGFVDVFYFYFYSFDLGNKVLGVRFGNHIGDWEHSMIRFKDSKPAYVYLSAHSSGTSFTYDAYPAKTDDGRPKVYVGTGTHANYAYTGEQDYVLPFGLLHDTTDEGTLWDVAKNFRGYWYDGSAFTSAGGVGAGGQTQDAEGLDWLNWLGRWGDEQYPDDDDRQYGIFGQYHYVSGPTGPVDKKLTRTDVCPSTDGCDIEGARVASRREAGDGEVYDEYRPEFDEFKQGLDDNDVPYSH